MRLIIFLLKCIVGILATVGLVVVAGVVAAAFLWERVDRLDIAEVPMPETAVLELDLARGIAEERSRNPLLRASTGGGHDLRELVETLRAAETDPRVAGLVLRVGQGQIGMAQMQELREAVTAFRESGKFAVAFAETYGEGGDGTLHYTLASAAERLWLQPSGMVELIGFSLQTPYLRRALRDIGIAPQLAQREEYKGVMNTFTDSEMPEPVRINLQKLVESWFDQVVRDVAAGRGLGPAEVREIVNGGPYLAQQALERKLVDQLGYLHEMREDVKLRSGEGSEFVAFRDYRRAIEEQAPADATTVALVYGVGPVVLAEDESGPPFGSMTMGADTVAQALADAIDDPEVQAILFRINSPGGSYTASDKIWREVQRAREAGKPVIVSMSDMAASGGYFVAAPANRIVAHPGTITGSIGVVGGKLVLEDLWDNLSVNWDGVQAGRNALIWSPNRPFSEDEWTWLQDMLDRTYEDFTQKVAEGRDMSREEVLGVAKGQVWSGEDAKTAGLVDVLGGYRTALEQVREAAEIDPEARISLKRFPEAKSTFERLFEDALGAGLEGPGVAARLARLLHALETLEPLLRLAERLDAGSHGPSLRAPYIEGPSQDTR